VSRRPVPVTAAAALEAVEGLAALGFGAFVAWETITGTPNDPATAWGVAGMALLGGICMLAVARGLIRAERWSRAPAVLTQLFALPVAWSLLQSDQLLYALPLGAVALVTLVLVLSGPVTNWLLDAEQEAGTDA
jgi:divalent metal cation (Fe/Co/Zn/Cd) transporter